MSASFDKINYSIRANKNVERKMLAECLRALEGPFSISNYRYVGLGSMWFTDFILFHRWLGIDDMVSIEQDATKKNRLEFNKPFACIRIEIGKTTTVLPKLGWRGRRSLVWLDYDGQLAGAMLDDIRIVCESALSGTIILISLNSNTSVLKKDPETQADIDPAVAFRRIGGDLVPVSVERKDFSANRFPIVLADLFFRQFDHALHKAGRTERFAPLFNIRYSDGAPMLTVGGMLANDVDQKALADAKLSQRFEFVTGEKPYDIDAPPLTTKEKMAFDQFLPRHTPPTSTELGFSLTATQIKAYYKLYRFYPVFGEWHP